VYIIEFPVLFQCKVFTGACALYIAAAPEGKVGAKHDPVLVFCKEIMSFTGRVFSELPYTRCGIDGKVW
jgi:hypothetical protein